VVGCCEHGNETLGRLNRALSRLPEELSACQNVLCTMELPQLFRNLRITAFGCRPLLIRNFEKIGQTVRNLKLRYQREDGGVIILLRPAPLG
jgi:hypothetical protein